MSFPRRASSFDKHTISSKAKKSVKFVSSERRSFRFSSIDAVRTSRRTATATALPKPLAPPQMPPSPANNLNIQVAPEDHSQDDFNISWLFQEARQPRNRNRPPAQPETRILRARGRIVNYTVSFSYYFKEGISEKIDHS